MWRFVISVFGFELLFLILEDFIASYYHVSVSVMHPWSGVSAVVGFIIGCIIGGSWMKRVGAKFDIKLKLAFYFKGLEVLWLDQNECEEKLVNFIQTRVFQGIGEAKFVETWSGARPLKIPEELIAEAFTSID